MLTKEFSRHLISQIDSAREAGLLKQERFITTPQSARVGVEGCDERPLLNLCANNYLGLASDAAVVDSAREALVSGRWDPIQELLDNAKAIEAKARELHYV